MGAGQLVSHSSRHCSEDGTHTPPKSIGAEVEVVVLVVVVVEG
jgi:hypothetical protein